MTCLSVLEVLFNGLPVVINDHKDLFRLSHLVDHSLPEVLKNFRVDLSVHKRVLKQALGCVKVQIHTWNLVWSHPISIKDVLLSFL